MPEKAVAVFKCDRGRHNVRVLSQAAANCWPIVPILWGVALSSGSKHMSSTRAGGQEPLGKVFQSFGKPRRLCSGSSYRQILFPSLFCIWQVWTAAFLSKRQANSFTCWKEILWKLLRSKGLRIQIKWHLKRSWIKTAKRAHCHGCI